MPKVLSPLRYPGGKSKLYNYIKLLIEVNNLEGCTYVEPFAGGCGLSLQLLDTGIVNKLVLNDIDISIYSFWYTVINNPKYLIHQILNTSVTINEWKMQKKIQENKHCASIEELAFSTLFLNRTNRSGILSAGPIGGFEQTGNYPINCRFKKDELINRIQQIFMYKDSICFYNYDAEEFLTRIVSRQKRPTFVFLDPPYFNKGKELYINFYNPKDHIRLASSISKIKKHWIVTYDNIDEIKELYHQENIHEFTINYSANRIYKGEEIMVYSNNLFIIPHPNHYTQSKVT